MSKSPIFTQNRELSWLRFNDRVLDEATDETVPLLERLKFVAIFTSNLNEFFMIRVGSLFDLKKMGDTDVDNKTGMTPSQQLKEIYKAVRPLYKKRERILADLESELRMHGIYRLAWNELEPPEVKAAGQYFKAAVLPLLSPQIIDSHHPFPYLRNEAVYVMAKLRYENGHTEAALVPVPDALTGCFFLPGSETRYISHEEIIYANLSSIFKNCDIEEKVMLTITRNGDINPDDEDSEFEGEDFRKRMKKLLKKRIRLMPVRVDLSNEVSKEALDYLHEHLGLTREQVFVTSAPLSAGYMFSLADHVDGAKRQALTYPAFTPRRHPDTMDGEPVISEIRQRDIILSYPFQSMEPFLQLLKQSAHDESVVSVKITIYRLSGKARLVDYLCAAAEIGKEVTVLIELRARFDEQNNIDWSERLENAGCTVIYGFEKYKVHSKICLITRRSKDGVQYITQIGTGNYNEKTATQYTDLSLMTFDQSIGRDANEFFKNMAIGNLEGSYEMLLVAPVSLKSRVLACMDREIAKRENGHITLKLNSLTDIDIIEKLKQASCAGVTVRMIVRGICCILPGIPGKTENIRIISVVGRFLEHSRVYIFGKGEDEEMFISSADFMTRNTQRRVEVACPVLDPYIRKQIHVIIEACLADDTKARLMLPNGSYAPVTPSDALPAPGAGKVVSGFDCQQFLLDLAESDERAGAENIAAGKSRVLTSGRSGKAAGYTAESAADASAAGRKIKKSSDPSIRQKKHKNVFGRIWDAILDR